MDQASVRIEIHLDLTDTLTIQWWMRTDTLVSGYQAVLMKGYPYNYSIWTYDDSLMFYGYIGSTGTTVYVTGSASLGDGEWHHYAVTADGSTLTIYEDGVALADNAYTGEFQDNTDPLYIGRTSWTDTFYLFDGGLDELVFHSEALSATEIAAFAEPDSQYCTGDTDVDGPTLSVTTPSSGSTSEAPTITIVGTASDESAIVSLTVNGVETTSTGLNYETWTAESTLVAGSNDIEIIAIDIAGNRSSTTITIGYEAEACGTDDVLLLTMDEDTSGFAVDESPNGLDGFGQSTTRIVGIHGNAVRFDGTNSYMTIAHDDALNMSDEFAIELWYRRDGSTTAYEILAMKGGYNYGLIAYGGFIIFAYTDSNGDSYNANTFGFNDGDWHHIVGVYDGTNVHLYVDGTLEASEPAGLAPESNTDDLYVGGFGAPTTEGDIDQMRVHDFALTPTKSLKPTPHRQPACPVTTLPLGTATSDGPHTMQAGSSTKIPTNPTLRPTPTGFFQKAKPAGLKSIWASM